MKNTDIKYAKKLFYNKKYSQAARILETQIFKYRESSNFYYLLGTSCLYTGDHGGAQSYLKRAVQLNENNTQALCSLAALSLRKGSIEEALLQFLEAAEKEKKNGNAKTAIKNLRKYSSPDKLAELSDKTFYKLFLPCKSFFLRKIITAAAALTSGFLLVWFIILPLINSIPVNTSKTSREGLVFDVFTADGKISDRSENYFYTLTEKEILKTLDRIIKYFNEYNDNAALKDINLILNSNAALEIKDRAELIKSYLKESDFINIKTSYTYSEIFKNPLLFHQCYIVWKGRVSNLSVNKDSITFDFLVGYHDGRILEGVIPVKVLFPADIKQGQALEILGKISTQGTVSMEAKALHAIVP
jgi:tetratricopeptide (TPR) repeat protein